MKLGWYSEWLVRKVVLFSGLSTTFDTIESSTDLSDLYLDCDYEILTYVA